VEDELISWPLLNSLPKNRRRSHTTTSSKLIWFGGIFRRVRFTLAEPSV
jgi:hypothetical protein